MASVVILRSTNVAPEPRVEKTARWLRRLGHAVSVIGWDRSAALPRDEDMAGVPVRRLPIPAAYGAGLRTLVPLARWQWGLLRELLATRRRYDAIHACDLDTLIPAYLVARLFGKALVYDIYDFYADSRYVPARLRGAVTALERWLLRRADGVIVVDESRLPQLGDARAKRLAVVYNAPEELDAASGGTPPATDAAPALRIAFVGLLSVQRGLREALDVVARHPDWHLDVAGYGAEHEEIRARVAELPNATFHGQVSYDRALALSASADVLFATYDPSVANHKYSSANKLFEAMMLGKPIVVARDTGMDRVVERHELGFVVEYGDRAALERAFAAVASWDAPRRAEAARRARAAYVGHYSAERMFERTRELYAGVLAPARRSADAPASVPHTP